MIEGISLQESLFFTKGRSDKVDNLNFKGRFPKIEHWRKGDLFALYDIDNAVTALGRGQILDTMFNSATQIASSSWYISLIDNTGFTALNSSDVMASHAGWNEFTSFVQSTRVLWGQSTSSAQSVTNASPATFDINGTGTLNGIFVTSGSAKGGTSGTLWSGASFSATVPVTTGDQLKITYTISD
jgi:hypothetical protein